MPPTVSDATRDAASAALLPLLERSSRIVLLTVMSSVREDWMLGVSAALHGIPIVIAGLGADEQAISILGGSFGSWRTALTRTALHAVHAVAPAATVVVLDGMDTVVSNAPTAHLAGNTRGRDVLVSAECNSWPKCFENEYLQRDPAHAECLRSGGACYANIGVMQGRSAALLLLLDAMQVELDAAARNRSASAGDRQEQAALHRLYLRGKSAPGGVRVRVDRANELALNLWACRGKNKRSGYWPGIEQCHARSHNPLALIRRGEGGGFDVRGSRPLVLHSNGDHGRMHWSPVLNPLLQRLVRRCRSCRPALPEHPVLLVSLNGSSLSSLARVLATAATAGARVAQPQASFIKGHEAPYEAAAARWLRDARHGYCAPTTAGDAGDCKRGESGTWSLKSEQARTWAGAAAECLRRCDGCPRPTRSDPDTDTKGPDWTPPNAGATPATDAAPSRSHCGSATAHGSTRATAAERARSIQRGCKLTTQAS